jgi:thiamine biosynthesis protein ThiS
MVVTVNGQSMETGAETLRALIEMLDLRPERVAAEVNMKVIRKTDYDSVRIMEGDTVEIVNFVGGG